MKNERIKIAFIIDQLGTGGTERQLKYLVEGLNPNCFDINLILLREGSDHIFKPENIKVCLLGVRSILSFNGLIKMIKLAKYLKEIKCDIAQTFFQDATLFGVIAAKLAGVRNIIVSVRDMLFWAKRGNLAAYRIISLMADIILVNSYAVQSFLKKYFPFKAIKVIHNGIYFGPEYLRTQVIKKKMAKKLKYDSKMPLIVLVSNCNRAVKRVDLLVESIPLVLKKVSAFFVVVGDGHLRPKLEMRAKELKIQKSILFLGKRDDIEKILKGSDLAVNTSESEGLSNSILEAMRAGLPVVASDVSGNRELFEFGNRGLLFKSGDYQDLAEKIVFCIKEKVEAEKYCSDNMKKIIRNFSAEKMIKRHTEFYLSLN